MQVKNADTAAIVLHPMCNFVRIGLSHWELPDKNVYYHIYYYYYHIIVLLLHITLLVV